MFVPYLISHYILEFTTRWCFDVLFWSWDEIGVENSSLYMIVGTDRSILEACSIP